MRTKVFCWAALLVWSAVPVAAAAGESKEKSGTSAVVAVFSLDGPIVETPMSEDLFFGTPGVESLHNLIDRMKKARDDKDVKAVVLLLGNTEFDFAQLEEIRQAMDEIKAAGKEIHAHADSLSLGSCALLSGASKLSVVPTGDIWIMGLYGETPYLRGLLNMLGVKPDFLTCGAYKSAAEIFMRKEPSPEAEQMQSWLLDSIYETYVGLIATGRRVPTEKVRTWIDGGPYSAEKAKAEGIIDAIQHRQDFIAELKSKYGEKVKFDKKYGKKKSSDLDLSSPLGLLKLWADLLGGPKKKKAGKDTVALVYVEGPIVPGKASPNPFLAGEQIAYSTTIRQALDEAANDEAVKAVVLRVHSPGGSATASEIILHATQRVKAKKPFVVSMGGVAGSGGYYVACGADTIFADAATITASIGVVGGKFATTDMWEKIGINWKPAKRGANADMLSSERVFTPDQRKRLQVWMDEIYGVFKGHVVAIRGDRLKKKIDEIAGGRVYTGRQALELGLVDRIGSLNDAIQFLAKEAKLKDYEVRILPQPKNFMELLLGELAEKDSNGMNLSLSLGLPAPRRTASLVDAALPYLDKLEPQRLAAVKMALRRLEMLQQERVLLMMPEISFCK
jgi:protease-4